MVYKFAWVGAVIALSLVTVAEAQACPPDTIQSISNSSICYWFVNQSLSFIESEINCGSNQGHLASISDGFTNTMLAQHAKKVFVDTQNFWIGGNDLANKEHWVWEDGAPFSFNNWAPEEPVELPEFDCIGITTAEGLWYTFNCFDEKFSVCEILKSSQPPTIGTIPVRTTTPGAGPTTVPPVTTQPPTVEASTPETTTAFLEMSTYGSITSSEEPSDLPSSM